MVTLAATNAKMQIIVPLIWIELLIMPVKPFITAKTIPHKQIVNITLDIIL